MQKRDYAFHIVDVFGEKKYTGNQLAVFTNAASISSDEMAAIARETNFSETTFITGINLSDHSIDVRIFTPGGEIPFAGHPTLGTACVANQEFFNNSADKVTLNLELGEIPVIHDNGLLWMEQVQPKFNETAEAIHVAKLFGIELAEIDSRYPIESVSTGMGFFIVPVKSVKTLKKLVLNMDRAKDFFKDIETKGILVYSPNSYNANDDLACRVFVPKLGISEDPATGSANGCLAAYLLKYNYLNASNIEISVAQGYEINRPSRLFLKASVNKEKYSIVVGGHVVPIAKGLWD